jgi:hypothetical protein
MTESNAENVDETGVPLEESSVQYVGPLRWQQGRPTEPGFWWIRLETWRPGSGYIYRAMYDSLPNGTLVMIMPNGVWKPVAGLGIVAFAGPIPAPLE